MKKSIKTLTATGISGLMLAISIMPAWSQDYSYNSYDSNYSYEEIQPLQTPNYQQNNQYQQQQPQNYQPQNNYYPQSTYSPTYNTPQNYNNTVPVQNNYNLPPLQGRIVTVPPGTMLSGATANRTLSSKNLRTGDNISVVLNSPFYYAGSMVLPAGTNIVGNVVMAQPAGRAGRNGQLMIVFNQAITPTGQRIGMTGKIATEDGSGLLKGGTGMDRTKEIVKDTATGAGAGALFGLLGSAISGGSVGKGTALGTAIGGGAGVAKTVIDKGKEVVIEAGEALNIILDSELRAGEGQSTMPTPPNYNSNYNYDY